MLRSDLAGCSFIGKEGSRWGASQAMKYPAIMFYTRDWLTDPSLTICDPATRGIWMDMLSVMNETGRTGEISGTPDQLSRLTRCNRLQLHSALRELSTSKTAIVKLQSGGDVTLCNALEDTEYVTVVNRRMQREHKNRNQTALRVSRFRKKLPCNGPVTTIADANASTEGVVGEEKPIQKTAPSLDLPDGFPITVKQAIDCASTLGCPKSFVIDTWNKAMGRGGRDARNVEIRSWVHYVTTEWRYEQQRTGGVNGSVNGSHRPAVSTMPIGIQIRTLEDEISKNPANKESVFYDRSCTDLQRASLKAMREKLKALKETATKEIINA